MPTHYGEFRNFLQLYKWEVHHNRGTGNLSELCVRERERERETELTKQITKTAKSQVLGFYI
jgi:hypothetical protein